jgi:hypothetical protein
MAGFERFHGDVESLQRRYYELAVWFFTSPFMAIMRTIAARSEQKLESYPCFALVYGQSKAGKTSFLETLLKMMIGQKPKIVAQDFTRTSIDALRHEVKGVPIIVDDLTQPRFTAHAVETIKNDTFGVAESLTNYPAVVISANEDVKAVSQEITRRTVIFHVQAGLKNIELMRSNIVRQTQRNIGTALWRAYAGKAMALFADKIESLKDEDMETPPDILALSSDILYSLFSEHLSSIPPYILHLSLDNYFGEKVTGAGARTLIRNAWKYNRKAFKVNKRENVMTYNAGPSYEADRIIKELPEDLESKKAGGNVIMRLDKAREFFDIQFNSGLFSGI